MKINWLAILLGILLVALSFEFGWRLYKPSTLTNTSVVISNQNLNIVALSKQVLQIQESENLLYQRIALLEQQNILLTTKLSGVTDTVETHTESLDIVKKLVVVLLGEFEKAKSHWTNTSPKEF